MSRTPKPKTSPVGIRLEEGIIRELDQIAFDMSRPGLMVTRADVVRIFVHEAIEARRKLAATKKK